jgi:hypothetical protein
VQQEETNSCKRNNAGCSTRGLGKQVLSSADNYGDAKFAIARYVAEYRKIEGATFTYRPKFDHHKIFTTEGERNLSHYMLMSAKLQCGLSRLSRYVHQIEQEICSRMGGTLNFRTKLVAYVLQAQCRISTVQARAYKLVQIHCL